MARLVYSMTASLDGFTADTQGNFDWATPDEQVHAYVNDLSRPVGTFLLGRRMYETMAVWDDLPDLDSQPPEIRDFAGIWHAADKVVFSTTLATAPTARTRIDRSFDPALVERMKATSDRDIGIAGPRLAAHAIAAGIVDDYHLFVVPVAVGGGTPFLPRDVRLDLELVEEHTFRNGTVHLHYRAADTA